MKRYHHLLLTLAAAGLFTACAKDDASDAFGEITDPSDNVREYMISIADRLVTYNLQELETALNSEDTGGLARYFYKTNGKALTEDGAVWTVTREDEMYGLVISKVSGESSWTLSYEGDFTLRGYEYPTTFSMTATAADASIAPHRSWNVRFRGERHEKKDFWCEFYSDGDIQYKALNESKLWNAYGFMLMTVYEKTKRVDKIVMQLKGGKSDSAIAHIE